MKSKFILLALIALAVAVAVGVPAFAEIEGSAHDFSADAWSGFQICAPCHTPHNASGDAALWARSPLADQGPYTLWSSDDILGTESLTCLSCHDGTLALEGVGGSTFMTGDALIGTDLLNDHPVGVAYSTSTSATRWQVPTANSRTTDIKDLGDLYIYLDDAGTDYRVECASCHDVHGSGIAALLRTSNAGSALCLSCHIR
jgi:predicted CXXCH cytochrome family protein